MIGRLLSNKWFWVAGMGLEAFNMGRSWAEGDLPAAALFVGPTLMLMVCALECQRREEERH